MIRATLSRVGLRSLAQVLLGMLAFALLIEIWTALSNGDVRVAGAALGVAPLFGAFIVAVVALVVISVAGHSASRTRIRDDEETLRYRFSCSKCGWTAEAPTIEEAQDLKRQHRYATHRESS